MTYCCSAFAFCILQAKNVFFSILENFEWVQFVSIKFISHKSLLALIYHIHAKLLHAFEWMDNTDIGKTNYSGDNTCDVYVNSNALQEHYQYDIKTPNIIIWQ